MRLCFPEMSLRKSIKSVLKENLEAQIFVFLRKVRVYHYCKQNIIIFLSRKRKL